MRWAARWNTSKLPTGTTTRAAKANPSIFDARFMAVATHRCHANRVPIETGESSRHAVHWVPAICLAVKALFALPKSRIPPIKQYKPMPKAADNTMPFQTMSPRNPAGSSERMTNRLSPDFLVLTAIPVWSGRTIMNQSPASVGSNMKHVLPAISFLASRTGRSPASQSSGSNMIISNAATPTATNTSPIKPRRN